MCEVYYTEFERTDRERKLLRKDKGFSLVEALVAIAIAFFIVTGIAGMLTMFAVHSKRSIDLTCLVNAAASGIEACRGGVVINNYNCNGLNISLTITGNCNPTSNQCSQITVNATYGGRTFSLKESVCNFP